jgi:Mg/Co/Ni transporter MgtE
MAFGFTFAETMRGSFHYLDTPGDEHPMTLDVRAEVADVRRFVLDPTATIAGTVNAEGLATRRPLTGTLEINPVLKRKVIYDFRFEDDDDRTVRFFGEKDLEALRLVSTMTTLPGSITCDETEIARAVLRFQIREELARFLGSFRPR